MYRTLFCLVIVELICITHSVSLPKHVGRYGDEFDSFLEKNQIAAHMVNKAEQTVDNSDHVNWAGVETKPFLHRLKGKLRQVSATLRKQFDKTRKAWDEKVSHVSNDQGAIREPHWRHLKPKYRRELLEFQDSSTVEPHTDSPYEDDGGLPVWAIVLIVVVCVMFGTTILCCVCYACKCACCVGTCLGRMIACVLHCFRRVFCCCCSKDEDDKDLEHD